MSISSSLAGVFGVGKNAGTGFDEQALAEINAVNAPTVESLKYKLQQLVSQGRISPQQAETILAQPSAFGAIDINPTAKAAQMQALAKLGEIGTQGGMTAEDNARLAEVTSRTGADARGAREAIMMNAKERGVSGGGNELADQLIAAQGAAGQANRGGLDVAAQASERALKALQETGQLGGQIRGQEYNEASSAAAAKDAIEKFNTANKQSVVNANVDRTNAAQAANLAEKTRIADTNVGLTNQERGIAANANETDFENRLKKAAAKAGQLTNMANAERDAAGRRDAFTGALLGAAGQVAAGGLSGRGK